MTTKAPILTALLALLAAGAAHADMNHDPLLTQVSLKELEWRGTEGDDPIAWDGEAWIGKDLHKLWLQSEGEYVDDDVADAEVKLYYRRAVAAFWDMHVGWRGDLEPGPDRHWLAIGTQGLAPYEVDVDATFFVDPRGRTSVRFQAAYELLFTQKLILTPDVEINLFGRDDDDDDTGTGAGLGNVEFGLRLRYEIVRELAPYIGVNWNRLYGDTADIARAGDHPVSETQWLVGVTAWY